MLLPATAPNDDDGAGQKRESARAHAGIDLRSGGHESVSTRGEHNQSRKNGKTAAEKSLHLMNLTSWLSWGTAALVSVDLLDGANLLQLLATRVGKSNDIE
jgi:hypothetical protein